MSKSIKKLYLTFGIFCLVVLSFVIAPFLMPLWDHARPFIAGWPFAQVTVFTAAVLMIIALNTVFRMEGKITARETEARERGEKIDY